tara:strand:- start:1150 stop:1575 length:426 start_codon:yes stop_codon:yes gene_type:complete
MTIYIKKATSDVLPNDLFSSIEVVELQMSSLQTNTKNNNSGIYQCWLFAHPENKKYTGPFNNFKRMISDTSYKILLNSTKFKVKLLNENKNSATYSVNVDAYDNKRYNLTWVLEKASISQDCKNCWMTTSVTQPQFIGQLN